MDHFVFPNITFTFIKSRFFGGEICDVFTDLLIILVKRNNKKCLKGLFSLEVEMFDFYYIQF